MIKHHKTALNMAKFIKGQSLFCWRSSMSLDLDTEADMCEWLHEDSERLYAGLLAKLNQE